MTKLECLKFIGNIKIYYPREFINLDDIEFKSRVEGWQELLSEVDYNIALKILKRWVSTNKWQPTISDILEDYSNLKDNVVDEGEAWLLAKRYHKRNYYGPGVMIEEKDNSDIPLEIQQTVKQIGFYAMSVSENENVLRSNFMRMYRTMQKRIKFENQLPKKLQSDEIKRLLPQQQQPQLKLVENKNCTTDDTNFSENLKKLQELKNNLLRSV